MRRPIRTRRLSIAAVLSLLAFVAVAGIGVRSFWVIERWYHDAWHGYYLEGGRIEFFSQWSDRTTEKDLVANSIVRGHYTAYKTYYPWWSLRDFFSQFPDFWKFRIHHYVKHQPASYYFRDETFWGWDIIIPLWFPLLLLLIAPVCWLIARSKNSRAFPVVIDAKPA